MEKFAKRIFFIVIICCSFFLCLEIISRILFGSIYKDGSEYQLYSRFLPEHQGYVEDKYLFWRFRPNWKGERCGVNWNSNSLGLRDVEFPLRKDPNTFRILSLGESGTFGSNIELEDTYNKQLEGLLNKSGYGKKTQFQVINAGQPSYTSFQGLIYLKRFGLKLKPDLIMVYFDSNDRLPSYFVRTSKPMGFMDIFDYRLVGPGITDRELYIKRQYFSVPLEILNKSVFYKSLSGLILHAKSYFQLKQLKKMKLKREEWKIISRPERVPQKDREWVFNNFISIAKKNHIKLLILIPPYVQEDKGDYYSWITQDEDIYILDLSSAFENSSYSHDELFGVGEGCHPLALGHKIEAETIYNFLVTRVFRNYKILSDKSYD
jgi:hypothetical protein